MKHRGIPAWFVFLSAFLFAFPACGEPAPATPSRDGAKVTPAGPQAGGEPAWQEKWDQIVAGARQEGEVRIYSVLADESRKELSKGFTGKYGIKVEYVVGRGTELATKIFAERAAGLFLADGISAGSGSQIISIKPKGIQEKLDPLLILPEVLDTRLWYGGQLPYLDKDHVSIALVAGKNTFLARNTSMVREDEVRSFMDLLDPKWKGKLIIHDMTIPGAANTWGSFMIKDVLGSREKFRDYLRQLARNEPFMTRDTRMVVESLARGKHAVAIGPNPENMIDFMGAGAPIAMVTAGEGAMITAGAASYSVPKNAGHPNASILFLNWLLSKDGASTFIKAFGSPSARLDVSMEGVHPSFKLDPNEKLFLEMEEGILIKDDVIAITKEVFAGK